MNEPDGKLAPTTSSVTWVIVDENADGQRIDNFLLKRLKGVPKSHIYRILRSGEVRVNSGRVDAEYRLVPGDKLRIPPVRQAESVRRQVRITSVQRLADRILYEDDALLIIDKPAGLAVHGGSGISLGAIEQLRAEFPQHRFLELVHRLDRETSGILMLAKKRQALVALHAMFRDGGIDKHYLVLVTGEWQKPRHSLKLPLAKYLTAEGERRVAVSADGQEAHTIFTLLRKLKGYTLVDAELKTGRTHQIRVHLAHLGYPIAGDDKYGDFAQNKLLPKQGLKRMFLHAHRLSFRHPLTDETVSLSSPLPEELERFLLAIA